MGQEIQVQSAVVGDVAMFDTDRSITGQDGVSFASADEMDPDDGIVGILADRLFVLVAGIDHVFVASNQVVIRRPCGWDDETVTRAGQVISDLFLHYVET